MSLLECGSWNCGADLLVKHLEKQGVKYVFGIPGAKIDRVFNALLDSSIKTIPVRHEANGAFIAGAIGRLTGKAGVTIVTSGPGCSNLVTGLATATAEGDPVVAIGGAVARAEHFKQIHQSMDTVSIFKPITKYSVEIEAPNAISEVLANAFRAAEFGRPGASFISLPSDVANEPTQSPILANHISPELGSAPEVSIAKAVDLIKKAKNPVLLLGLLASRPENSEEIKQFLKKTNIPVTITYQAAGSLDSECLDLFAGRVGLFNNQPGDKLLSQADLIITIGYSPIEYEPKKWNTGNALLIHIDVLPAEIDSAYSPDVELIGDISETLKSLTQKVNHQWILTDNVKGIFNQLYQQRKDLNEKVKNHHSFPIHPLSIVKEMQDVINNDTTLCLDMGSFHIWIARYLYSFRARQLLISNGQQTMGVALPWAIGASIARPHDKIVSVSGDGGFLQSSMELETAVRLKSNILHIIWVDNTYNMVAFQEINKYGRSSGINFGPIDFKAYAESFGAKGFNVESSDDLKTKLRAAMNIDGPAVIAIPVDYSYNHMLMEQVNYDQLI